MDKLTAIKIKYDDGTYSDEIPVSVLSENVEWDNTHTLVDVLGSIDVNVTGTIQDQISQLFNEKVSSAQLQNYVANQLNIDVTNWLNTYVNPVGSAVIVDSSLSIKGAAADAQEIGIRNTFAKNNFIFSKDLLSWRYGNRSCSKDNNWAAPNRLMILLSTENLSLLTLEKNNNLYNFNVFVPTSTNITETFSSKPIDTTSVENSNYTYNIIQEDLVGIVFSKTDSSNITFDEVINNINFIGKTLNNDFINLYKKNFFIKEKIQKIQFLYKVFDESLFIQGWYNNNHEIISSYTNRYSITEITFDEETIIMAEDGYLFYITYLEEFPNIPSGPLLVKSAVVPKNYKVALCFRKATETQNAINKEEFFTHFYFCNKKDLISDKNINYLDESEIKKLLDLSACFVYHTDIDSSNPGGYSFNQCTIETPIILPYSVKLTGSIRYQLWKDKEKKEKIQSFNWKTDPIIPKNTYFTLEKNYCTYNKDIFNGSMNIEIEIQNDDINTEIDDINTEIDDINTEIDDINTEIDDINTEINSVYSNEDSSKNIINNNMIVGTYVSGDHWISAPEYYIGMIKPIRLLYDFWINFDQMSTYCVKFYNNQNLDSYISQTNSPHWGQHDIESENNIKIKIPAKTYFTIHGQLIDTNQQYDIDSLESYFFINYAPEIVKLNNDFIVPEITNDTMAYFNIPNNTNLLWFSDIHADETRLKRIVDFYNWYETSISDAICTGDIISDKYVDDFSFWNRAGAQKILTCIGNHDGRIQASGTSPGGLICPEKDLYDKFMAPFINLWNVDYVENKPWYRKVYNNNVLLIVLSCVTPNDTELQITYLSDSLNLALQNDYGVIIAYHYPADEDKATLIECPFCSLGSQFPHMSQSPDFALQTAFIDAVNTFKNNGGDFICYLTGHTHTDWLSYYPNEKQLCLTIDTAGYMQGIQSYSSLRQINEKSQDLFNIVTVDRVKKTVMVKRIGSNRDKWYRLIDSICLNYNTCTIIK